MNDDKNEKVSRRPIASRERVWARRAATGLKNAGVKPNTVSVMSFAFALLAAAALYGMTLDRVQFRWYERWTCLALIVAGVMGRLICNLLDGMVAVEGGLKTPAGEIYNDLPDRLSDLVILVCLGLAASEGADFPDFWVEMGWAAAALSILTAYLRYLGAACGVGHFFSGPMAKQHRMAMVIASVLGTAVLEPLLLETGSVFRFGLSVICLGAVLTCLNRLRKIVIALNARAP